MKILNSKEFKQLLNSGAANLSNNYQEIDALNVFPVPDGDTGTNMSMTFTTGVNEAIYYDSDSVGEIAKVLSKGLLMGARGNSGVILSQIFRGFYQAIENNKNLNALDFARAFENGTALAYKAVMRPVEGTILTVIRESSWYANKYIENNPDIDIIQYMEKLIEFAKDSLDHTPELLPVLKEVGVVDSGGSGLLLILEGFLASLYNKPIEYLTNNDQIVSKVTDISHDEFLYCTEFIIKLEKENIDTFSEVLLRKNLEKIGNSIVVVQDEDLVKVHVHTLTPGDALNLGQRNGEFLKLKIENMQQQHDNIVNNENKQTKEETKEYGMISVGFGNGLINLLKEYRCDYVVTGGQTNNPSTEDFVEAINNVNARNIFILPNNSNIILAAKQAGELIEDKNIIVIETKTIIQGLRVLLSYNDQDTIDNNILEMNKAMTLVNTASVTYAIKDTNIDGTNINQGDYIGIYEKSIIVSNIDNLIVYKTIIDELLKKDNPEIITIISGQDALDSEIDYIKNYINSVSNIEIEYFKGDQPVYRFILGIE